MIFDKGHVKFRKMKKKKKQNKTKMKKKNVFNDSFIVEQMFVRCEFTTAQLTFAHIRDLD